MARVFEAAVQYPDVVELLAQMPPTLSAAYLPWCRQVEWTAAAAGLPEEQARALFGLLVLRRARHPARRQTARAQGVAAILAGWAEYRARRRRAPAVNVRQRPARRRLPKSA